MKRSTLLLTVAALAAGCATLLPGCKSKDKDERPILAVSIEPQRNMLERIVGDRYRIVTLMPSGENPETYEPSPRKRMDAENAKAYFKVGYLVFENNLEMTSKDKSIFVNTSEGIEPIYGTHSHDDEHSLFLPNVPHDGTHEHTADPHVWTSVRNARVIGSNMLKRLVEIDPAHAGEFQKNFEKYAAHLDSLDQAFAQTLSESNGAFLVWHPSLSYFARDYGLRQISVSTETKEATVGAIRHIIDEAKSDSVKAFFYQSNIDSRQARSISDGIGAKMVLINTMDYDWEKTLSDVVNEISGN